MAAASSPKAAHLYRPQKTLSFLDTRAISHSVLVDGAEHVVSHDGTSQYNKGGTGASACGLAALNFARIAFLMEQDGLKDATLLQGVLARECAEVQRLYSLAVIQTPPYRPRKPLRYVGCGPVTFI